MHWDTFKQDNYNTVGGHGGCRVGKAQAGTTSPMPDDKGLKLQLLSRDPPTPFLSVCIHQTFFLIGWSAVYEEGYDVPHDTECSLSKLNVIYQHPHKIQHLFLI